MSKRGSRSAKFIGGKSWKVGNKGSNIPKRLKQVKANSKNFFLSEQFNRVAENFGFTNKDSYLLPYRKGFLNDFTGIKQQLCIENIGHFKAFAKEQSIEFTLANYFDNKYYLKDYTGLVKELRFDFDGLQRKELIEKQLEIRKLPTPEEQKQVILSHLDFLISNCERKRENRQL